MGIAGYLEEVRTGETRADMNGHVKTNVLSALQGKVIPVNTWGNRKIFWSFLRSRSVLFFLLFFCDVVLVFCRIISRKKVRCEKPDGICSTISTINEILQGIIVIWGDYSGLKALWYEGQVLPHGIEIGMSVPPARTCSGKQQVTRQGAGYPMHTECCYQPSGKRIYYVI